jgi:acyl-CoA thioesterase
MESIDSPFEKLLDMRIVEKAEGLCKIAVSKRPELTNPHGNFHGGAIASIIDTAAVQALRILYPQGPFLTVGLEVRYKKPSSSGRIVAEARPNHLRGKFFKTEVVVRDDQGQIVAEACVKSFLPAYDHEKGRLCEK